MSDKDQPPNDWLLVSHHDLLLLTGRLLAKEAADLLPPALVQAGAIVALHIAEEGGDARALFEELVDWVDFVVDDVGVELIERVAAKLRPLFLPTRSAFGKRMN